MMNMGHSHSHRDIILRGPYVPAMNIRRLRQDFEQIRYTNAMIPFL